MERIRGVNLSGWFIPEPWVTPSLFAATGASNEVELQVALGSVAYNERMRQHYETFITEDDFRRMSAIGLNAVRLPVPWYAFGSQGDGEVYIPLVDYIDRAFEWAKKFGMQVLLDLATVPGGQGDSNNSRSTPESTVDWHSSANGRHIALGVLDRLATRYGMRAEIMGIELLDSPIMSVRKNLFTTTDGIPSHYLRNFYRDAYGIVRMHMPEEKMVVFSASGYPSAWKHFMRGDQYKNVCMDVHLYHYRDEMAIDITTPKGLSSAIARNRRLIKEARAAGFPVIVGEWSGAAVFSNVSVTPEGRAAYERVFISNQMASFADAYGWFFQTWKTEKRIAAWDARAALGTLERAMLD
ncbi:MULTISPECIES: glycoside hydrolase family 5 protein [Enorma]|uniref:Exo-1,3-beta-glucanase D n=1 Tax=Enorma shizhengliae TaxID=2606615 RepID=A0A7K0G5Y3_9ACTN|nr:MULTISPECIES: cellulase family glycosylhydrolase [Enorma]MRX79223.1 cellulase family glycosylhydrolase [Enorma shizhengliae]